jgi:hypothetical protein
LRYERYMLVAVDGMPFYIRYTLYTNLKVIR